MPWANGGGVTSEIARGPREDHSDFDWRISLAEVAADGPFSALPGIDRIITVVSGAWMRLQIDGEEQTLWPDRPCTFSGDSSVHCTVPAPTRDLNVMTRRGRAGAQVDVVTVSQGDTVTVSAAAELTVICLRGALRLDAGADHVELSPFDAVRDFAESAVLARVGTAALVRIHTTTL